jgi:hypothetical protein
MYLDSSLSTNAKQSMEEFLDEIGNNNHNADDKFDEWVEEFTNTSSQWWDFNESDLTINNINILLQTSAKVVVEYEAEQPEDVDTLLRRYGLWQVQYEQRDYFKQMWEETWEEKFPEENHENEE